jgi:hypothetical protein
MDIIRHPDGSLTVPVVPGRHDGDDLDELIVAEPGTRTLRPGEGGYTEALAEWDAEQHPDRTAALSTPSGRQEAMAVVHAAADDPAHVAEAVDSLDDPEASAEALRHVLVGGVPSVAAFADEVAEAEGGEVLPAHRATKVIGEVLAEIDERA